MVMSTVNGSYAFFSICGYLFQTVAVTSEVLQGCKVPRSEEPTVCTENGEGKRRLDVPFSRFSYSAAQLRYCTFSLWGSHSQS